MGNTTSRILKRIQSETPDFEATIAKVFAKFNASGDGYLTLAEFETLLDEVGDYLVELIDKSDTQLEMQDLAKSFITLTIKNEKAELFEHIDANQDGRLSLQELRDRVFFMIEQGTGAMAPPKPKPASVFDRLTEEDQFTGMYANHHETPVDVSDDRVEWHATSHARSFRDAPVQKYGVQVAKPVHIWCWNGVDKHATAKKVLLTNVRTFEQLVTKCTQACAVSPQPLHLFTPEGKTVKTLDKIEDGANYLVIQSGATYKGDRLPLLLREGLPSSSGDRRRSSGRQETPPKPDTPVSPPAASSSTRRPPAPDRRASGSLPLQVGPADKSGSPASASQQLMDHLDNDLFALNQPRPAKVFDRLTDPKGYTGMHARHHEIEKPTHFFCWNGLDKHAQPQKILLTNVRTLEQLITKCTQACRVSPQPTCLHTVAGKPIKNLDSIVEGENYLVIQSGAKYNPDRLPLSLRH